MKTFPNGKNPKDIENQLDALKETFQKKIYQLYKNGQVEINNLFMEIDQSRIEQLRADITKENKQ